MTGTPAVSWFWPNPNMKVWLPQGDGYRNIVGNNESGENFLCDIETSDLLNAVASELTEGRSSNFSFKAYPFSMPAQET